MPVMVQRVEKKGGKHQRLEVAATSSQKGSRRLFITDRKSKRGYLVDCGSEVSALPNGKRKGKPESKLYAANGTEINTYGEETQNIDLGLRREFKFPFIRADVQHGIIGANLLDEFNLSVDVNNKRLIDATMGLCSNGFIGRQTLQKYIYFLKNTLFHFKIL